jgi:uncharacterized integral membrane protein
VRRPAILDHPLLGVEHERRRRILRAVRAGDAVDDPADADVAARTAAYVRRTAARARSPRLLLVDAVLVAALVVFVLAGGNARLPAGLPLAVFLGAAVVARVVARFALAAAVVRADEAERRNRELADLHSSAAGDATARGGGRDDP